MHRLLRPMLALVAASAALPAGAQTWLQNQISWSTLRTGISCNAQQQSVQVIGSQNDFQVYWQRTMGQAPGTIPKVDWMKDKLVAVHLGQRKSGGYTVEVRKVEKVGMAVSLKIIEHTPMDGQWVAQSITSPFVIIRIAKDAGQIQPSFEQIKGFPVPGVTITGADRYIRPGYDKPGGGSIDPNNKTDWGTVDSGNCALPATAGVYTMDNVYDWRSFYAKATGNENNTFGPPTVDWAKYRLVVIQLGERPTSRYRVIVNNVEPSGNGAVLRAVEEMPVAGSWVNQRKSYPYVVIRVPRTMGNFQLDLQKREGNGTVTHT